MPKGWDRKCGLIKLGVAVGRGRAWGVGRSCSPGEGTCGRSSRLSLCGSLAAMLPDSLKQEDFNVKKLCS